MDIAGTLRKMFLSLIPKNLKAFAKKKASPKEAIQVYLLAWSVTFVFSLIVLAFNSLREGLSAAVSGQLGFLLEGPLALAAFLALSVFGLAWGIAAVYLSQHAGCYVARSFFGGKGELGGQFYLNMLFSGAIMAINSIISLFSAIVPVAGPVFGLLSLLLGIYGLYLLYLAMKSVHKLGASGAIVSALSILLVQAVVFMVIAFFVGMLMIIMGVEPALPLPG
jgi:hypothetical protein